MKYVTKENFQQYNATLKDYIDDTFTQDLTSYGVSWKPNVADPHLTRVGNMTYHKSLPIQNNMKGCIAQMKDGAKIIYYLNHNDWRFKENPDYLYNKQVIDNTITDDVFKDLKYEHQYIKINNNVLQVKSINTETKTASIEPIESGTYDIELGSCTNGYDGEVMVEVPEFWIKSWDTDTRREVRITPSYIDDSWEYQPHILVGAYKDTVLNTVPTNMGYLSTLELDSAVCICNIHDYCRGGSNESAYDKYITTNRFRSMLGKPRTYISRATMRANCRRSGKEILSYLQYKRVMYWLYVIEYANFNSQEEFKEELTKEGFRQGGLGMGVSTIKSFIWANILSHNPLILCGYTNIFGNNTSIKTLANYTVNFDTFISNVGYYGIDPNTVTATARNNTFTITNVKQSAYRAIVTDWYCASGIHKYKIEGLQENQSITFKSGNYTQTIDTNSEFDINWDVNIKEKRLIIFNFIGDCNIKLTIVQASTVNADYTFDDINVPRWHGIEQPFGDTWTMLDGIIITKYTTNGQFCEYHITDDPLLYSDSNYSNMKVVTAYAYGGFVKEWQLGNTAEIISRAVNYTQGESTYKCDYIWNDDINLSYPMFGGCCDSAYFAGFSCTQPGINMDYKEPNNGIRSSCIIK